MGKRELIALLNLSSWCLMMVERLFLAVPRGCLQFVIVVFPDHTHYFCSNYAPWARNGPAQVAPGTWPAFNRYLQITRVSNLGPLGPLVLISSPEPKAQGELIVWDSSRRPSVGPHFQT